MNLFKLFPKIATIENALLRSKHIYFSLKPLLLLLRASPLGKFRFRLSKIEALVKRKSSL